MTELWLTSTIAAGLLGHLVWLAAAPRRRLTRIGVALPALSLLAWATFLAFGEPFAPFAPPPSALAGGSIELWTDGPVMVAGRAMGTFGSINFADRLLTLAAGPAVSYSWLVVVLPSEWTPRPASDTRTS